MDNIYQNLFAPEVKVCGRWRRKYTLYHHLLLTTFDSPFLPGCEDGEITAGHLLQALHLTHPRLTFGQRPRTRPTVRDLYWSIRLASRESLTRHCLLFQEWLYSHYCGPHFWQPEKASLEINTAPETYALAYGLTSRTSLTEEQAWNKSPGQAATILGTIAPLYGAELAFADPAELTEEAAPYQPTTREEVYERAVRDLGQAGADAFISRWEANQSN